jgi:DNA gyrase subunit A
VVEEGSPQWRLDKAREREHIVSAIARGQAEWRQVLEVVEGAGSAEEAIAPLCERFGFDRDQATAVVDMQVRRVSQRDRDRITAELMELRSEIASLQAEL